MPPGMGTTGPIEAESGQKKQQLYAITAPFKRAQPFNPEQAERSRMQFRGTNAGPQTDSSTSGSDGRGDDLAPEARFACITLVLSDRCFMVREQTGAHPEQHEMGKMIRKSNTSGSEWISHGTSPKISCDPR